MKSNRTARRSLMPCAVLAALLASALPGHAARDTVVPAAAAPEASEAMFERLDSDRDGHVSRAEAGRQSHFLDVFAQSDTDRDGRLSREEFDEAHAAHERLRLSAYAGDMLITARVIAALFKDPDIPALELSVETAYGEVLLSGVVHSEEQARRAREIAARTSGVRQVHDGLVVKG